MLKLKLNSEFGTLRAVITHRPGHEIERLTPYNTSELLFEDVPYLEVMQKEHDEFTSLIHNSTGARVYRLHELLVDVLIDDDLLFKVFSENLEHKNLRHLAEDIIPRYSTSECSSILIAGIKVKELRKKFQSRYLDQFIDAEYIIPPSPNLYFMRDPAAVIQTGVICSEMKYSGRQRESNLLRIIFENHHLFKDNFNRVYPNDKLSSPIPTIEGGDVIVLSDKALAIGCSERTDSEAIQAVARSVMSEGAVERVYEVMLPAKRNFMHLDTVFTIIDENLIVTYPDAMNAILKTVVYRKEGIDEQGQAIMVAENINESIISVLKKEIDYLEVIETGDGNPDYALREQWYDGANVFAIGPRRVISYNRNKFTNRALREAGVEVLETSSSELSRGLGGPRCMTMPIDRQAF
ncbi:MAG: arginine deiminase [Cyclobacteriaceae bacterium]|nr:arginine deiminase [Cyclobacteriaceae bacterium]